MTAPKTTFFGTPLATPRGDDRPLGAIDAFDRDDLVTVIDDARQTMFPAYLTNAADTCAANSGHNRRM
jgi:hypothetical protein